MYPNPMSITAIQAAYATGEPWLDQLNGYLHDNLVFAQGHLAEHLPKVPDDRPRGGPTSPGWTWAPTSGPGPRRPGQLSGEDRRHPHRKRRGGRAPPSPLAAKTACINTACPLLHAGGGLRRMCTALTGYSPATSWST